MPLMRGCVGASSNSRYPLSPSTRDVTEFDIPAFHFSSQADYLMRFSFIYDEWKVNRLADNGNEK